MDQDAEKAEAANEVLARRVNEGIERGQWPGELDQAAAYRCECAQPDCNRLITLTPREYETVRGDPRHFLVFPGHERAEIEAVIRSTPSYLVVEKRDRAAAAARVTDPRR